MSNHDSDKFHDLFFYFIFIIIPTTGGASGNQTDFVKDPKIRQLRHLKERF